MQMKSTGFIRVYRRPSSGCWPKEIRVNAVVSGPIWNANHPIDDAG
ncbi:hypothetical protein [Bradyrhizobium pachyrhizi]